MTARGSLLICNLGNSLNSNVVARHGGCSRYWDPEHAENEKVVTAFNKIRYQTLKLRQHHQYWVICIYYKYIHRPFGLALLTKTWVFLPAHYHLFDKLLTEVHRAISFIMSINLSFWEISWWIKEILALPVCWAQTSPAPWTWSPALWEYWPLSCQSRMSCTWIEIDRSTLRNINTQQHTTHLLE